MNKISKRTPLEAIRAFCVKCMGGSFQGVSECNDMACPFHPYRHGTSLEKGRHSPVRACRKYCFEYCLPESGADAVKDCGGDTALIGPCPVFPFRMGKNPNISAATRDKARQRELRKVAEGTNTLPIFPAHTPIGAPESTKSERSEL